MKNTKQVPRREVGLRTLDDLKQELGRIQQAHDEGQLVAHGNWSAGQILEHVAILPEHAIDGFPEGKVPWLLKVLVQVFAKKGAINGRPPPPGITIPKEADYFRPGDGTTFEQGMARLRNVVGRIENGEKLTHPSPLFGKMSHDEWVRLNLGHMNLHFSFLSGGPLGDAKTD